MLNTVILALSAGIFIIGVHQSMKFGMAYSYWIFMFSIALLLWYNYRKKKNNS
jgi:hypothetical protein